MAFGFRCDWSSDFGRDSFSLCCFLAYGLGVLQSETRPLLERDAALFSNIGAIIVFLVGGRFVLGEKSSDLLADTEVGGEPSEVRDSLRAVALPGGVTLRIVVGRF